MLPEFIMEGMKVLLSGRPFASGAQIPPVEERVQQGNNGGGQTSDFYAGRARMTCLEFF